MLTLQADEAEEGDPSDQGVERAGEASSGGQGSCCTGFIINHDGHIDDHHDEVRMMMVTGKQVSFSIIFDQPSLTASN